MHEGAELDLSFYGCGRRGIRVSPAQSPLPLPPPPTLPPQTQDFKIRYTSIQRLFILPKTNTPHTLVVVSLDPPIRKGQTYYTHMLCQFPSDTEETIELDLTPEQLAAKNEKVGGGGSIGNAPGLPLYTLYVWQRNCLPSPPAPSLPALLPPPLTSISLTAASATCPPRLRVVWRQAGGLHHGAHLRGVCARAARPVRGQDLAAGQLQEVRGVLWGTRCMCVWGGGGEGGLVEWLCALTGPLLTPRIHLHHDVHTASPHPSRLLLFPPTHTLPPPLPPSPPSQCR